MKNEPYDEPDAYDEPDDWAINAELDAADRSQGEMTFLEHLEEFRWTVFRSLVAFLVGVGVVVFFLPKIGEFLQTPIQQAYASNGLNYEGLVSYKPMGVFSVFIQIALLGGLVLSMPWVLYFIACFIAPGLTDRERRGL